MSCFWAWFFEHPWAWWLILAQVVGLAAVLCFGVGYVLGADRWVDRGGRANTRR